MNETTLLPHLFRVEYQKIVSVLCGIFGIQHIEIAEDLVSDTFLSATEIWSMKGIPQNPTAWLYTVAKNKTKNYLKHHRVFEQKISPALKYKASEQADDIEIDLSEKHITDSQLAMMFAVCNPIIPEEAQIALALNLFCGFSINEIADAFLVNKEVVYKRIQRAKEKLKDANIKITRPTISEAIDRLESILKTIYLLFSEGYYSSSQNIALRQDFCLEAMRLTYLLIEHQPTNLPQVNALMALMCFHSSRFRARIDKHGEMILYHNQDEALWDRELIERGGYFLSMSSAGNVLSKYHIEAGIAYWHTQKEDTQKKWEHILELYNSLLIIEYSPIAALNRIYAFSKVAGKMQAISAAVELELEDNHFYHLLLGDLYTDVDEKKALAHFMIALKLAKTTADKKIIRHNIERLQSTS